MATLRIVLRRGLSVAPWLILTYGCQSSTEGEVTKKPILYTGPIVETTNVVTLFSDSARLKFKLKAPLEQKYDQGDVWYRQGVLLTFYDGVGRVQNTLSGNVGHYDKGKNLYHVRGHVRVVSAVKKQQVDTEELFFDQNKERIYTDTFVRIETATEVLTGTGLTANQDFSRYTILHPAGTFVLKEGETAP
jgi:LPS export ABC transporter protein LptC